MFENQSTLVSIATTHYKDYVIREIYKVFGCFDFLGNPVNMFTNLGTGVKDFFYEPIQGVVKGPGEFGAGLARGTLSLVNGTLQGTFGSVGRITGALGKGLAAITLDDSYQESRRQAFQDKPNDLAEGLTQGGKQFVKGIAGGVAGVFISPFQGAKKEGVEGFMKGLGKGLLGVVAKPVGGVVDLATGTLQGISTVAKFNSTATIERTRVPRFISAINENVTPYSAFEANGAQLLLKLDNGAYAGDVYISHVIVKLKDGEKETGKRLWIVFTNNRVLLLTGDKENRVKTDQIVNNWEIYGARLVKEGVELEGNMLSPNVLDFIVSTSSSKRKVVMLPVSEPSTRQYLMKMFTNLLPAKT